MLCLQSLPCRHRMRKTTTTHTTTITNTTQTTHTTTIMLLLLLLLKLLLLLVMLGELLISGNEAEEGLTEGEAVPVTQTSKVIGLPAGGQVEFP